jgi:hypothetical protein
MKKKIYMPYVLDICILLLAFIIGYGIGKYFG